ncbi:ATP-binding protein [Spirochaeta thermophila]|uniref:histidine kinase n=1 Tax=Winmispira thermophila (strain ATCC 49972 / DSM 6192 / RI 19.B1) TaxID=665571 RepID=E0RR68_WINT6|nr:sensor histidine kinase [Spirochaeta thermophila]ADN03045.1 signal transduction histidine kinase [Spirochaeta thermophila DSM 6192]
MNRNGNSVRSPHPDENASDHDALHYRELSHRVRNDISLLVSYMRLKAASLPEESGMILEEVAAQLRGLAHLYSFLELRPEGGMVHLSRAVSHLVQEMAPLYKGRGVSFVWHCEDLVVSPRQALPLLLLVHELVVNALKHAFDHKGGTIAVSLVRRGEEGLLSLTDDGLPFEKGDAPSEGMTLVEALTRQMGGSLRLSPAEKTWLVTFPLVR